MPRVLVCLDEVQPANGGACMQQAWVEQPTGVLPELTGEQVQELAGPIAALFALAWAWKFVTRSTTR